LVKVLKSGASVFLEYRNSFVPTEQAKNIASTVSKVFSDLLTSPKVAVGSLTFLSDRNKSQLEKWNSTPLPNVERTIHELIYENVLNTPTAEAVCSWDGSLSYRELDELACRLAVHLQSLGIGPEVIVPLCFDKSKWNVVAVLATLYAGGACKFLFSQASACPNRPRFLLRMIATPTDSDFLQLYLWILPILAIVSSIWLMPLAQKPYYVHRINSACSTV
jgi:non-ribosomal peptide synthetase component F